MKTNFGNYLRSIRENKNFGLRQFAREIGMQPSNYSNIENGFLRAPNDTFLNRICQILTLSDSSKEKINLFDYAAASRNEMPLDIRDFIAENPVLPAMLRSMKNKKLEPDKLEALLDDLEKLPEEVDGNF